MLQESNPHAFKAALLTEIAKTAARVASYAYTNKTDYLNTIKFNVCNGIEKQHSSKLSIGDLPIEAVKQCNRLYGKYGFDSNKMRQRLHLPSVLSANHSPLEAKWKYEYQKKYGKNYIGGFITDEAIMTPLSSTQQDEYVDVVLF